MTQLRTKDAEAKETRDGTCQQPGPQRTEARPERGRTSEGEFTTGQRVLAPEASKLATVLGVKPFVASPLPHRTPSFKKKKRGG